MPTRTVGLLIVLFWLATAGWYVHREIMPYWSGDGVPSFAIDLSDEAVRQSLPVNWTLSRAGHKSCPVRTTVTYHDAEDEFSLNCVLWKLEVMRELTIEKFHSSYRVTRQGRLVETNTRITLGVEPDVIVMNMTARMSGGGAVVTCQIRSPWGNLIPEGERVSTEQAGTLNPLHPVHRLQNVRPGQRWVQPLSDPLADAQRVALLAIAKNVTGVDLKQMVGHAKPKSLIAEVIGPKSLEWHGVTHDCFVIEYRGDHHTARTWVRASDGWVLRQEASAGGDEWVLQRD